MTLPKKAHTFLVTPRISDRVPLVMDILPKITKLAFEDVYTHQQLGLERKNCMVTIQASPTRPKVLKPMKWATSIDQARLMNLLFMPHFGHSLQVNTYVKQLLVYFHKGCLWLDQPYPLDIELISSIIGLPKKGNDPAPYWC